MDCTNRFQKENKINNFCGLGKVRTEVPVALFSFFLCIFYFQIALAPKVMIADPIFYS